jgi:hypothetical protein
MRRLVGADPGPWSHWGRPERAGIGAVVVWAHHVGKIVGQENGHWVIESGNDGHALRTRSRSIAGAPSSYRKKRSPVNPGGLSSNPATSQRNPAGTVFYGRGLE